MQRPEQTLSRLRSAIRPEWTITFFSALVFGLAAHFYKLTNWLPNWDSLVFRYDAQDMLHFGRYFLSLACGFSSYYDLPWLNGLLSLLLLACAAAVIADLFQFHEKVPLVLTGALVAVFPTVTSTLSYNYVADGYCLALLLACLSARFFTRSGKFSFFAGAACLWISVGIYQAYITLTITLLLLFLLDDLLFGTRSVSHSLRSAGRFLAGGVLAGAVYLVVLKLLLWAAGTQLSDYQSIDSVGSSFQLSTSVYQCTVRFIKFFLDYRQGIGAWFLLNLLLLALLAVFVLSALVQQHLHREPARLVLVLVYLAALPFGASALYFLDPFVDYHNLMTMGYCVFYLAFVLFYEHLNERPRFSALKNWSILLVGSAVVFNCIVLANVCYHLAQLSYERSYSIAIRMADRIEQLDDAESCTKLAVLGTLPGSELYSADLGLNMTGFTEGLLLRPDDPTVNQSVLTTTLNDYCALDLEFVSHDEKEQLLQLPEIQQMPLWPQTGSVAVVGDTIVIRVGEGVDISG